MGNNFVPKFIFRLSRFPVYRGSVLGRFYCIWYITSYFQPALFSYSVCLGTYFHISQILMHFTPWGWVFLQNSSSSLSSVQREVSLPCSTRTRHLSLSRARLIQPMTCILCLEDSFQNYSTIYAVFRFVSFLQVFPSKRRMFFSYPPWAPHFPLISSPWSDHLFNRIHSFSIPSDDRSKASSKTMPPHSVI